jgi:hypothetical protein
MDGMTSFTAWLDADILDGGSDGGRPVRLESTDGDDALREAQRLLVSERALGRTAGFRVFDDLDGRLVHEGRLTSC